jgi:thioredoxin reductase
MSQRQSRNKAKSPSFDVIIIGGGPAGLNAALVLARARRPVLVIDDATHRNKVTHATHGFITRDKITPEDFRRICKRQVLNYPKSHFIHDTAVQVSGKTGNFQVRTNTHGTVTSRKLLFATGLKEKLPKIPGLEQIYGQSAHHCPYCDGWEYRDKRVAILGTNKEAVHQLEALSGWTHDLVLLTNKSVRLSDEQRESIISHGVEIMDGQVTKIESNKGQVTRILVENGNSVSCNGIFFHPELIPGSKLPSQFLVKLTKKGTYKTDDSGKTNVPGVYVAGDAAGDVQQLIAAAAQGATSAISINGNLTLEDWQETESVRK